MDSGTAFQMTDSIIYCIKVSQIFNGNVNSSRIDVIVELYKKNLIVAL